MRNLILAAATIAALALTGPALADDPIVIKFSHVVAPNTPKGLAAEKFKELAEKLHQRQGQGRSLSELPALQGQGRARGAAARRGADAGAVELQVRPDRGQAVRGVRSALHPAGPEDAAEGHRRSARRQAAQAARFQGHDRSGLLGQRLQADERQQEAGGAGRLQGPSNSAFSPPRCWRRNSARWAPFRR